MSSLELWKALALILVDFKIIIISESSLSLYFNTLFLITVLIRDNFVLAVFSPEHNLQFVLELLHEIVLEVLNLLLAQEEVQLSRRNLDLIVTIDCNSSLT